MMARKYKDMTSSFVPKSKIERDRELDWEIGSVSTEISETKSESNMMEIGTSL